MNVLRKTAYKKNFSQKFCAKRYTKNKFSQKFCAKRHTKKPFCIEFCNWGLGNSTKSNTKYQNRRKIAAPTFYDFTVL